MINRVHLSTKLGEKWVRVRVMVRVRNKEMR